MMMKWNEQKHYIRLLMSGRVVKRKPLRPAYRVRRECYRVSINRLDLNNVDITYHNLRFL